MQRFESSYRPDIDGLRAVAVLGVLLFHLDSKILGGGFVGVDVFFVISGYLITSIIAREQFGGKFSILRFYERRIRRVCPALFAVIAAVVAVSLVILFPKDLVELGKSVRYAVFGFSNFIFLRKAENYFGQDAEQIPLLHTWSLAVEEQFYLVFPLLMVGLRRVCGTPKKIALALGVLLLVSLTISVMVGGTMRGFFLLQFRAWELLMGACLAMAGLPVLKRVWNHVLGLTGIALILFSMLAYNETTPFPGMAALPPCLGAALLILAGRDSGCWSHRLLALKPLVGIGLISYSLYLWHWPLIVFARHMTSFDGMIPAAVLVASGVLGYLSWRFIERPFRAAADGGISRRRIFVGWAAVSVVLLAASITLMKGKGYPGRFSAEVNAILEPQDFAPDQLGTLPFDPRKAPVFGAKGAVPEIAVWGDSHAQALLPVLDELGKETGKGIRYFGFPGVPPVVGVTPRKRSEPAKISRYSQETLKLLTEDPTTTTVILHARWLVCDEDRYGGIFEFDPGDHRKLQAYFAQKIRQTVGSLLAAGKRVVLVYPVPQIEFDLSSVLARNLVFGRKSVDIMAAPPPQQREIFISGVYDSLGENDRLIRIRPGEKLVQNGMIRLVADGHPVYHDSNHLTVSGSKSLKDLFRGLFTVSPQTGR